MKTEKFYNIEGIYMCVRLWETDGWLDTVDLFPQNPLDGDFTKVIIIDLHKAGDASIFVDPSPLVYASPSWLIKAFSFSLEIVKKYEKHGLKFLSDYNEFLIHEHSWED